MIVSAGKVLGAFVIQPELIEDERGYFARTFCVDELGRHGIDALVVQRSISYNRRRGTLRGMHFQVTPHEENKIVSCRRGSIYDVMIDLRRDSPTYRSWFGLTLSAEGAAAVFVPKGCAHGFVTLADETIVDYQISGPHHPESARGVRYDDPAFGVEWPIAPVVISRRDLEFAAYDGP